MVRVAAPLVLASVVVGACGDGAGEGLPDGGSDRVQACPDGELATGFTGGVLECAPIGPVATAALGERCSFYFGWSDSCGGCSDLPDKWGRFSGIDCENGLGADNTCEMTELGGATLPLLGLNPDGDVNGDDKLSVGMTCAGLEEERTAGPCPEGSYLTAIRGGDTECVTADALIVEYIRESCEIYFGWRDSCTDCDSVPAKWGHTGSLGCTLGEGAGNTCNSFRLGEDGVFTFGLDLDGDVNGDDKLYVGFRCAGATESESSRAEACPAGQMVRALGAGGGVECASPRPAIETAIQDGCQLYFGWRDGCDGCADPPARWGRVGHSECESGAGDTNTCASSPLDGTSILLFGLNTGGDVDDNDKLYMGLSCL